MGCLPWWIPEPAEEKIFEKLNAATHETVKVRF